MECFRHPDEEAIGLCRNCKQPLCPDCYEQSYGGITRVCSDTCAQVAGPGTDPADTPDSTFARIYGLIFLPLFMALVGGIVGAFAISTTVNNEAADEQLSADGAIGLLNGTRFVLAHLCRIVGLTSLKADFVFGALVGFVFALVYIIQHRPKSKEKPDR